MMIMVDSSMCIHGVYVPRCSVSAESHNVTFCSI